MQSLGPDVDLDAVAAATPGFSGADLANLVNEAAILATRRGATAIEAEDFWSAQDKIEVGDPRETPLSPAEKRRIAVHESGHAVVAHLSPSAKPLKRVTIILRGMTLGSTRQYAKRGLDRLVAEPIAHETVEQEDLRRLLSEAPFEAAPRAVA